MILTITSLCKTPIKIEGTYRHYCVLQCSAKYCSQIPNYFGPLSDQMNNSNSGLHFFHWLVQLPLDTDDFKFNACFELPSTELKKQMIASTMGSVDTWFLNLYQSCKMIFDDKTEEVILDGNQETIFDKNGNFLAACSKLYSLYQIWYERNHPEGKFASYRKFGSIITTIVGQSKTVRKGNTTCKRYKSNLHTIGDNLKLRHGFDVNTFEA